MPTIEEVRSQYPQYGDMSDTQLATAIHQKFYSDMPQADFMRKIGMPAYGPPAQDNSFIGRVGRDYQGRIAEGQSAADAYVAGKQGESLTALDMAGKIGIGVPADVVSEAVKSAYSYAPQGLKNAVNTGVSAVANLPTNDPRIPTVGGAVNALGNQYQNWAQGHPDLARHVEAAANIGSVLAPEIPVKGTTLAGSALDTLKGEPLLKEGVELPASRGQLVAQNARQEVTRAQAKKAEAQAAYRAQANISLSTPESQQFSQALSDLTPKSDLGQRSWARSTASKYASDIQESLGVENPDFQGLLETRKDINSSMKAMYKANDEQEAQKLQRVKDALDDTMTRSDTAEWQMANHMWQQHAVLSDTEDWVSYAQGKAQPANSLDTKITNYLNSNASRGLRKEERAILEDVVNNTSNEKLRKGAASGLTKYVAGAVGAKLGPVGSIAGYLVGHYGSEFAKDAAMEAKLAKLDAFRDMIEARKPPVPPKAYPAAESFAEPPMNIPQKMKANAK